jgi:hypothetical protein
MAKPQGIFGCYVTYPAYLNQRLSLAPVRVSSPFADVKPPGMKPSTSLSSILLLSLT